MLSSTSCRTFWTRMSEAMGPPTYRALTVGSVSLLRHRYVNIAPRYTAVGQTRPRVSGLIDYYMGRTACHSV